MSFIPGLLASLGEANIFRLALGRRHSYDYKAAREVVREINAEVEEGFSNLQPGGDVSAEARENVRRAAKNLPPLYHGRVMTEWQFPARYRVNASRSRPVSPESE